MGPGKAAYEARKAHKRAMEEKRMREADVMEEQRRLADSVALKALRFIDQLLSGRAHIQVQVGAMPVQVRLVAGDGVEPEDAGRPVPPHGSGP